jgi:hypothetical protein
VATAVETDLPVHGSYIHDAFVSKDYECVAKLPKPVAFAMAQQAYPNCTLANYYNKGFFVVGATWTQFVVLYLADFNWYMYLVARPAMVAYHVRRLADTRPDHRDYVAAKLALPDSLPEYC